jgi:carbamoyl-phosphate synthase large subunit
LFLRENGLEVDMIAKINEGRPDIVDVIKNGEIQLVINTPIGKASAKDDSYIRKNAIRYGIPYITTVAAAVATANGIAARLQGQDRLCSLQEYHANIK